MWIQRLLHRLRRPAQGADPAEKKLVRILSRESAFDSRREFLAAVLAELATESALGGEAVSTLVEGLSRFYGSAERDPALLADLVWFWGELAEQSGSPFAGACHAEALLASGEQRAALDAFLIAFAGEPSLVHEFSELKEVAAALGGRAELGYQLAWLRAALADPGQRDSDADEVRELYSELLDEHSGDPEALEKIRELGTEIDRAVDTGRLPRALVRRGASRPVY